MEIDTLIRHYVNISKRIGRSVDDLTDTLRFAYADIESERTDLERIMERTIYTLDSIIKDLRVMREMVAEDTQSIIKPQ